MIESEHQCWIQFKIYLSSLAATLTANEIQIDVLDVPISRWYYLSMVIPNNFLSLLKLEHCIPTQTDYQYTSHSYYSQAFVPKQTVRSEESWSRESVGSLEELLQVLNQNMNQLWDLK